MNIPSKTPSWADIIHHLKEGDIFDTYNFKCDSIDYTCKGNESCTEINLIIMEE